MIHDLLLPITETAGDEGALSAAIALAGAYDAHLSVVQPVNLPMPMPGPWGLTPDVMLNQMYIEARAGARSKALALRERLAAERITWDVHVDEARFVEPPRAVARLARYSDLCVVAAPRRGAQDSNLARAFFSALLFESGRPVLVVPAHHPIDAPFRRIMVAWKATRESTRALHDALALFPDAESVEVVTVDPAPESLEDGHAVIPGVEIGEHLARHAQGVNVISLPRTGQTVATTLLRHSVECGAQLLVAGGFGHSRLREWVLGGATRELLLALHLPILFSH